MSVTVITGDVVVVGVDGFAADESTRARAGLDGNGDELVAFGGSLGNAFFLLARIAAGAGRGRGAGGCCSSTAPTLYSNKYF